MKQGYILGVRVDTASCTEITRRILEFAQAGESRIVGTANAHCAMQAYDSPEFREAIKQADLVTPDGMPVVWALRAMGLEASRVYGPTLTEMTLEAAAGSGIPVGFYGGAPEVLARLVECVRRRFAARIAYAYAPPFRPLDREEDERVTREINACGARILYVGLGCPKQELWMAQHRGRIGAVMLGVGAAFDFLSGAKAQAPRWMQEAGLEWVFRLLLEPRRLWRRYLIQNPRFAAMLALQLLGLRRFAS